MAAPLRPVPLATCLLLPLSAAAAAARCSPDSSSLLQHSVRADAHLLVRQSCIRLPPAAQPPAGPPRSLAFIHIPRTAGTTIESCTREGPPEGRWGSERPSFKSKREKGVTNCYMQHVPPALLPGEYEGRETFCVVRDPYERAISQFGFMAIFYPKYKCTAADLNDYLRAHLSSLPSHPYRDDCHLLPQAAFVYAWDADRREVNGEEAQRRCGTVLRYESLDQDFNATMADFGLPYRITRKTVSGGTRSADDCQRLSVQDLESDVRGLIEEVYAVDFQLLNYTKLEQGP